MKLPTKAKMLAHGVFNSRDLLALGEGTVYLTYTPSSKAFPSEWASKRYDITEWAKDPFGGWQDKRVIERAVEKFKVKLGKTK